MHSELKQSNEQIGYRVSSAAKALDCSERSVWNLIEAGRLRTTKIGRMTIIPASDLRALVEAA
jgi:excisionase family DNA binding protein